MLDDHQSQKVSEGSQAFQAGRDLTIIGPSVTEIRELCSLFLRDNFPKLREEARQTAEAHVRKFAQELETTLTDNIHRLIVDKFSDPDVQATINDAVQATARKGDSANSDLLALLIMNRVSADCDSFKEIVFAEAVKVAPKLTREQIAFLALVLCVYTFQFNVATPEELERYSKICLEFCAPAFGLSESKRQHLQYTGVASVAGRGSVVAKREMYGNMASKYADRGWGDFRFVVTQRVPSLAILIEEYSKNNCDGVEVTSVGMAVAVAYFSQYLGPLDFSMWIN